MHYSHQDIARELITLVQWLMGSPAGLKLNAQLTQFFGHFFIYHIYLWTGKSHVFCLIIIADRPVLCVLSDNNCGQASAVCFV